MDVRERPVSGGGQRRPIIDPIRGPEDFAAAFNVSRETIARLAIYETLLRQWQKAVNLVAPSTLDEIWHRHFADSAQLLPLARGRPNLGGPRLRRRLSGAGHRDPAGGIRRRLPILFVETGGEHAAPHP